MSDQDKPTLKAAYGLDSPEANRRLYRHWAATYDRDFAERSGYRFAWLVAEAFLAAGGTGPVLDAGCGTGLIAEHLPKDLAIDGVDISPQMLAEARRKGRYARLVEADLTQPLPFADAVYAGLTSAGTFTHGHVGPEVLRELLRVLKPGAVCALSGNKVFYENAGFREAFAALTAEGTISPPRLREERIYEAGAAAPEGHEHDRGFIIVFSRL